MRSWIMDFVKSGGILPKLSFSQKESLCENAFRKGGPFWHMATDGTQMDAIFISRDDFVLAMNIIALCSLRSSIRVITFEIMSDHLHFLLEGKKDDCSFFMDIVMSRIKRMFSKKGKVVNWSRFVFNNPIPITDLRMLRNEIVYVNRNGFLVDVSKTPFSYEWGAGYLYFNALRSFQFGRPVSDLTFREKRLVFHSDNVVVPCRFRCYGDVILPISFCDIEYGESFFRDGTHYFNMLSKAFEAYSESAKRLGDKVFINDEEVYPAVVDICRRQYGLSSPRFMGNEQRIEIAKVMHNRFNSSNEQIRRIIGLELSVIKEMFPSNK